MSNTRSLNNSKKKLKEDTRDKKSTDIKETTQSEQIAGNSSTEVNQLNEKAITDKRDEDISGADVSNATSTKDGSDKTETTVVTGDRREGGSNIGAIEKNIPIEANAKIKLKDPTEEVKGVFIPETIDQMRVNTLRVFDDTTKLGDNRTYFREIYDGLLVTNSIRSDVKSFDLVKAPLGYLKYENKKVDLYGNDYETIYSSFMTDIVRSTMDVFCYGTAYTKITYNDAFFTPHKLLFENDTPLTKNLLTRIGYELPERNVYEYVAGIIHGLLVVMRDNRIAQINHPISTMAPDNDVLIDMLSPPIETPIDPNPAMLAAASESQWIKEGEQALLDRADTNYILGKTNVVTTEFNVKKIDTFAINKDHFASAVWNTNLAALVEGGANIGDERRGLLAHSFVSSHIECAVDSELRPMLRQDPESDIRNLVLNAARYPLLSRLIMAQNIDYVNTCNFVRPIADTRFYFPEDFNTLSQSGPLVRLVQMSAGRADITQLTHTIAREVSPMFMPYRMVPIRGDYINASAIVLIYQMLLFALVWPTTFNVLKGEMQDELLSFFREWYDVEYGILIQLYGTKYSINAQGAFIWTPGQATAWNQSDYLTELFPTLFSGVAFNNCPRITMIMSFFQPLGASIPDTRAIAANFPRLSNDPRHYIPFMPTPNPVASYQITTICSRLRRLSELAIFRARNDQQAAANRAVIKSFTDHLRSRIVDIAPALTNHYPLILDAMANFRLNFTPTFSGNYATDKPLNYTITSSDNPTDYPMIRPYSIETDINETFIDTGIIWPFLMQSEFPLVRNVGKGSERVPITEKVIFPDPGLSYIQNESLMITLREIRSIDAFMALLNTSISVYRSTYAITGGVPRELFQVDYDVASEVINKAAQEQFNNQLPLVIDANSVLADVVQWRNANYPIFRLAGVINNDITEYIINNNMLIMTDGNAWRAMLTLQANQVIAADPNARTYIDVYVLLGLVDDGVGGRELNLLRSYLPPMTTSQYKRLFDDLSAIAGVDTKSYSSILTRWLGNMSQNIVLKAPQIRRLEYGVITPYDPQRDIPAFRFAHYFLTPLELQRLNIGLKMFFNDRLRKVYRGLRLCQLSLNDFNPDYIPDPEDRIAAVYTPGMFIQREHSGQIRLLLNFNGVQYLEVDEWPKLHLTIANRSIILPNHYDAILAGIDQAKWMVDVDDVSYFTNIRIPGEKDSNTLTLGSLLRAPKYTLHSIIFYDSLLRPNETIGRIAHLRQTKQSIFPRQAITLNRSVRGLLAPNDIALPGSVLNNKYEVDTGTLTVNNRLLYTEGTPKLDLQELSMTNNVRMFSKNVKLDDDLHYQYKEPVDILDLRIQ